jgi:hypothetical protein
MPAICLTGQRQRRVIRIIVENAKPRADARLPGDEEPVREGNIIRPIR